MAVPVDVFAIKCNGHCCLFRLMRRYAAPTGGVSMWTMVTAASATGGGFWTSQRSGSLTVWTTGKEPVGTRWWSPEMREERLLSARLTFPSPL